MKLLITIVLSVIVAVATKAQMTFPYPEIPLTLATPSERGAYLLEHYWDNYDFGDTTLVEKPEIAEQGFANFIDLLPRFDSIAANKGIMTFGEKAFGGKAHRKVAERLETMTEHYLANPNSPMRNEELYISFLEAQIAAMEKVGDNASRPKARLAAAMKNRPGTIAADFAFTTREGQRSSLHKTEADNLLLIFYDPACEHCSEILTTLRNDNNFREKVASGKLRVLAVYTEGNRQLWRDTCGNMPEEWTVAIDESGIVDNNIYDIPAMPIFYILDKEKRVIKKDPALGELYIWLNSFNSLTPKENSYE